MLDLNEENVTPLPADSPPNHTAEWDQPQPGDGFFTDIANTRPHVKIALEGFAGSGKSFTTAQIAAELHRRIGSTKPVVIFDTELSAKFMRPFFLERGIRALVKESRSLADWGETLRRCISGASDILVTDSISHIWEDFLAAYLAKVKRNRLQFEDWGPLKTTWKREFSEALVRAPVHVLVTGRAGYEYENEVKTDDEGNKRREIYKSGVKMKVEGETAYEFDLLVLMERFEETLTDTKRVYREAMVLKDRSNTIDGKTIKNPTYKDFEPAIDYVLAADGPAREPRETPAGGLFAPADDQARAKLERQIVIEEIEGMFLKAAPGQTTQEKKWRGDAMEKVFSTRSWKQIEVMPLARLKPGLDDLKALVAQAFAERDAAGESGS